MILVTLGTQDKPFTRLLDAVQKQIDKGNIKDEVYVQAGCTKYESKDMHIFDLIPIDEFDKMIDKADLIITHGGVGNITGALKKNKKIIVAPRLSKYKEHINDHQKQITNNFSKEGFILALNDDLSNFEEVLKKIKKFKPQEFKSNTNNMIRLIEELIDK